MSASKRPPFAALALALVGAGFAPSAIAETPGKVVLSRAFDGAAEPDVVIGVESRPGAIRMGGATGKEPIDMTDYSGIVELATDRDLLLGPANPPLLLPAGEYVGDVVPWSGGALRLVLHASDGMRATVELGTVEAAATRLAAATADAIEQPGDSWWVALRLPTAAGALVVAAPTSPAGRAPRARTEIIRRGLRERLLHSGRPIRRKP